jgi:hypothetical protein
MPLPPHRPALPPDDFRSQAIAASLAMFNERVAAVVDPFQAGVSLSIPSYVVVTYRVGTAALSLAIKKDVLADQVRTFFGAASGLRQPLEQTLGRRVALTPL